MLCSITFWGSTASITPLSSPDIRQPGLFLDVFFPYPIRILAFESGKFRNLNFLVLRVCLSEFVAAMTLSKSELHDMTEVAVLAARQGGSTLLDYAKKGFEVHRKNQSINLVTEADLRSEETIIQTIRQAFPEHQIFSEEQGLQDSPAHPIK